MTVAGAVSADNPCVPTTTIVLLAVFAAGLIQATRDGRHRRSGWRWFGVWALTGFLAAFATLSFAIGLLILPLAVVALAVSFRFATGAEMLGLVGGVGAMCVLIGALNVDEGTQVRWWFGVGTVLVAAAASAYWGCRRLGSDTRRRMSC